MPGMDDMERASRALAATEPDTPHFNKLTPAEAERIDYLAEECAEVVQQCMKTLSHGWKATDYATAERLTKQTGNNFIPVVYENRLILEEEVRHVMNAIWRMAAAGDLPLDITRSHLLTEFRNNEQFHHQGE